MLAKGGLWQLAILAFVVMIFQDLFATAMVVTESHFMPVEAGLADVAEYLTIIVLSVMTVGTVLEQGWKSKRARVVILSLSAANFIGTFLGVSVASALVKH